MIADLENLLKVQRIDLRIAELRKEIETLPKQIAALEATLNSHIKKLEADRALLAANQKERRQLDGDVQMHQQKISKLRDQTLQAKTNEQYRAFQHEIEFCEQAIRKVEDRILELMEGTEPLEANVKTAEGELAKEKVLVERRKAEARERTAADQKALAELLEERKAVETGLSQKARGLYDKLAKKPGKPPVSDASDGRCSACQLELRPQLFVELRKREQIQVCENCNRILYYNPAVTFDPANGGPTPVGTRVDMT